MSFQTHNCVHLWNTNLDIFDEIRELSDPLIDTKGITTVKVQKGTKNINKICDISGSAVIL